MKPPATRPPDPSTTSGHNTLARSTGVSDCKEIPLKSCLGNQTGSFHDRKRKRLLNELPNLPFTQLGGKETHTWQSVPNSFDEELMRRVHHLEAPWIDSTRGVDHERNKRLPFHSRLPKDGGIDGGG